MMPGMGMAQKSSTDVRLPLAFVVSGLVAFLLAQSILLSQTSALASHVFRIPTVWMAAHFLLLGFVIMIVMGAMYQLVPVAFLVKVWSQKFGVIQYAVTVIGIILFSLLLGFAPAQAYVGAVVIVIGILMFLFQMFLTIKTQENKTMITTFVLGALISLFFAIIAGFFLAWNIGFGEILAHQPLFMSHLLFGLAGWFTLLIFGFSYQLIPMFSLSHGFSMKGAKPAFILYVFGLVTLILSFWSGASILKIIGFALLFVGFSAFFVDVRDILKNRMRRKLDKPLSFSVLAVALGYSIHFIAFAFAVFNVTDVAAWSWLVFVFIFCWIIFSILGYLCKIVPFLWWTHKYSDQMGQPNVPTLAQLVPEKIVRVLYIVFLISLAGLLVGAIFSNFIMLLIFQILLLVNSIVYVGVIIRIFRL